MQDHLKNIEKTRNTAEQLDFYNRFAEFLDKSELPTLDKFRSFPVFTPRQTITTFLERYELYKVVKNVPGNILECGVGSGLGLMTFAHLCSIFEPYHYVRKIIGFDTFAGFAGITDKDRSSKAEHLKPGGLSFDSYDVLKEAIELFDLNRALGHIPKAELVRGDISKTLPQYLDENPSLVVSLLYLDLDLYKPTLDTLRNVIGRVPKSGVIAFDELNHPDYPGETLSVLETLGLKNLRLRRFDLSPMMSYVVLGD